MKVQVSRAEVSAAVGCDRHAVGQHAVPVIECLQRSRVFRPGSSSLVTAGDQNRFPVVGRDAHLMGEYAGVDGAGLFHRFARREVLVDSVNVQGAGIIERNEDVLGRDVRGHVDGPRRQRYRLTVPRERAARRIDAKRGHVMVGSCWSVTRCAAARRHVQIASRRVGPGVLHARKQGDRRPLDERSTRDIYVVVREFSSDVGV